jgi:hypothetical protein
MSKEREALERFATLLMRSIRDEAIHEWDMIVDGRMGGTSAPRIRERLGSFAPAQLELLKWVIPQIVDTTLHHLLWTLEENEWLDIAVRTDDGTVTGVRDVFYGPGSLYTSEGWISRYSQERYEELV